VKGTFFLCRPELLASTMMILDARTLAAAFVLLSAMLGVLLFFAWTQNRKVQALAWWGATFCLLPIGIGMANLGHGAPGTLSLLIANAVVTFAYGLLYAGCRSSNGRSGGVPASLIGPASWIVAFRSSTKRAVPGFCSCR
jgi:hypothetical protein